MIIDTWRDPYEAGFSPTQPKQIEIHPGLTVLVGCNGYGKTTLLQNIKESCSNNHIPIIVYDNLADGGHNALSAMIDEDLQAFASIYSSSEGERIIANVDIKSKLFSKFIKEGIVYDRHHQVMLAFGQEDKLVSSKTRVFLFDAVDSGLSVDSIVELKELFNAILEECKQSDRECYIIIAANEYELARNSDCFDVNKGKYLTFKDYEEYRSFIIKSRKNKEARIEKQIKWRQKQKEKELKEYLKIKSRQEKLLAEIGEKKEKGIHVSLWDESDAQSMLEDYVRHHVRFLTKEDIANLCEASGRDQK